MNLFGKPAGLSLYITPLSIELVEIKPSSGGFKIQRSLSFPTPVHSIDENGRILDPRPIGLALREQIQKNKFPKGKTWVSLWGAGVFAHLIKLPPLEREEMREALISEAERYAVFAESEPVVDFEVLTQAYPTPTQQTVDVFFIAAQRELMSSYHEILKLANLPLAGFDYSLLSILRAHYAVDNIKTSLEENQLWGMIGFTPRKASLSVWHGSLLKFYRELDIPSVPDLQNFTRLDLALSREEVILDIKNSLDYFKTMSTGNPLSSMYLAMDAADKNGAKAFSLALEKGTGIRINPLESFSFTDKSGKENKVSTAALGAACAGTILFPRVFDLVHPEWKAVELTSEFKALLATNAIFILLVGIYFVTSTQAIEAKKQEISANQQLIVALNAQVGDPNLSLKVSILGEIEKLSRYPIDGLFSATQQRIPKDTWINTLVVKQDGKFSLTGGTLTDSSPLEYGRNLLLFPDIASLELVNVSEVRGKNQSSYYVYGFSGQLREKKFE